MTLSVILTTGLYVSQTEVAALRIAAACQDAVNRAPVNG